MKPVGWRWESYRHYLASKGVTTNMKNHKYFITPRTWLGKAVAGAVGSVERVKAGKTAQENIAYARGPVFEQARLQTYKEEVIPKPTREEIEEYIRRMRTPLLTKAEIETMRRAAERGRVTPVISESFWEKEAREAAAEKAAQWERDKELLRRMREAPEKEEGMTEEEAEHKIQKIGEGVGESEEESKELLKEGLEKQKVLMEEAMKVAKKIKQKKEKLTKLPGFGEPIPGYKDTLTKKVTLFRQKKGKK